MAKGTAVLRDVLKVDRRSLAPGAGLRAAVGIAVCVVVGLLSGQLLDGVSAAIGALTLTVDAVDTLGHLVGLHRAGPSR